MLTLNDLMDKIPKDFWDEPILDEDNTYFVADVKIDYETGAVRLYFLHDDVAYFKWLKKEIEEQYFLGDITELERVKKINAIGGGYFL